jgi:hypothetical protein
MKHRVISRRCWRNFNSHIPRRSPAALIHTCHAATLPFSDSAVSFVKVRVVDGNIRTASPATPLLVKNLRGTLGGSRRKPNAGRSHTCRPRTVDANSHIPCRSHAALCRGLEKLLSERLGRGIVWERHGLGMACVNQTRPHCVNQVGKTQSKPSGERHGMGTTWYVWISLKPLKCRPAALGFCYDSHLTEPSVLQLTLAINLAASRSWTCNTTNTSHSTFSSIHLQDLKTS